MEENEQQALDAAAERDMAIRAKVMALAEQYAVDAQEDAHLLRQKFDKVTAELAAIEDQLGGA